MRIFILILFAMALPACGYDNTRYADPEDGPNNVVYQFIDAETMKPIQGAYVNPIWMKPTPSGKIGSPGCVRAALLRSDADGWVRMKGPKGGILANINFMVPGYDSFNYKYALPDSNHVLHMIEAQKITVERYPAWAKNLEQLGYHYEAVSLAGSAGYYKSFSIGDFKDSQSDLEKPQIYFIKHRSFPSDPSLSIFGRINQCGDEGVNIGMDYEAIKETSMQRAIIYSNVLCDEKWDTATGVQPFGALTTAMWLIEEPMNLAIASSKLATLLPNYPKVAMASSSRAFTAEERTKFCAWIQPYVEKYR
jgi:hypothetical protein